MLTRMLSPTKASLRLRIAFINLSPFHSGRRHPFRPSYSYCELVASCFWQAWRTSFT